MSDWTKEAPKAAGWYWYKRPCDSCGQPHRIQAVEVEVWEGRGEWFTDPYDHTRLQTKDARGLWLLEPIAPPAESQP